MLDETRQLSENTQNFQHQVPTMVQSVTAHSPCMLDSIRPTCSTSAITRPRTRLRKRTHVPHAQRPQTYVVKRNQRERARVGSVNSAFDQLRQRLPVLAGDQKISKINILRCAIDYINRLQDIVTDSEDAICGASGVTDGLWEALQQFCSSNSNHDSDVYTMLQEYSPDVPKISALAMPSHVDQHQFNFHEVTASSDQGPAGTTPYEYVLSEQCNLDQKPQSESSRDNNPWLQRQTTNNIDIMKWQRSVLDQSSSPSFF